MTWARGRKTQLVSTGKGDLTILLAHGAGTNQHHRLVTELAEALVPVGLRVVTFDYPYTAEGRKPPDRASVLLESHRAVFESVKERDGAPPILAGRSMGGRMSTMLAAEGIDTAAVLAYAYPLHPPGRHDRLRSEHLLSITVPMLFVRGERDALGRSEPFDVHVRSLPNVEVIDIEGEDHSLGKPGTPSVLGAATRHFLDRHFGGSAISRP